jgi:hypothetical protein
VEHTPPRSKEGPALPERRRARYRAAAELILGQADGRRREPSSSPCPDLRCAARHRGDDGALSLAAESVQSPTPSNRMGAFHEVRNRSASACHARRVGRFGSDSKHTAAAAGGIAAANINHQHLHTRLRLVRYVLPEYVCGDRLCHVAGKSAMQSELHYVAARLQAAVLTVRLPRGKYPVNRLGDPPRATLSCVYRELRPC